MILNFVILIFTSANLFTGPSHIESEIRPISINEKGDILCRTRFTKNENGAYRRMPIKYGYCVITKDSMIYYQTQELVGDGFANYDTLNRFQAYWDSVFKRCYTPERMSEIGHRITDKFDFKTCNVEKYKVDEKMSVEAFEKSRKVDLSKVRQEGLFNGKSARYFEGDKVHVLYDFGEIVILSNESGEHENGNGVGAMFDYYCPGYYAGEIVNIGFEISTVTGVLRVK